MADELAAISPPGIKPIQPTGKNRNIAGKAISGPTSEAGACGKAVRMSCSCGYTMSEASPTRIDGRGRRM
jgi:hypothetical protein